MSESIPTPAPEQAHTLTKYSFQSFRGLQSHEFVKETKHFLIKPNGQREAKKSGWTRYFDTAAEAIEDRRSVLLAALDRASRELKSAEERLTTFSDRHPPQT